MASLRSLPSFLTQRNDPQESSLGYITYMYIYSWILPDECGHSLTTRNSVVAIKRWIEILLLLIIIYIYTRGGDTMYSRRCGVISPHTTRWGDRVGERGVVNMGFQCGEWEETRGSQERLGRVYRNSS